MVFPPLPDIPIPGISPVALFPAAPSLFFANDSALQGAVDAARKEVEGQTGVPFTTRVAIIDLGAKSASGTLKWGGHQAEMVDYIASMAKVCALFGAFALRDMVFRFAMRFQALMSLMPAMLVVEGIKKPTVFDGLHNFVDPSILYGADKRLSALKEQFLKPGYAAAFTAPRFGQSYTPAFTPGYRQALHQMIVPSSNGHAAISIHGIGYAYLNGALQAVRLWEKDKGLWLAGDFMRQWPYATVGSDNDAAVAQAGTALNMAKLMALIVCDGVIDGAACKQMREILAAAVTGPDQSWLTRSESVPNDRLRIPLDRIKATKLGLGPLKKGGNVSSEVFHFEGLNKAGRNYAVCYQNFGTQQYGFDAVCFVIRRALEAYE